METATKSCRTRLDGCFWKKISEIGFVPKGYTFKKKTALWPLFMMGFTTASRLEPLWGGSLLFITKFSEIPGTHFINLWRMKGWVDLGATQWFWMWYIWMGNPMLELLGHCSIKLLFFQVVALYFDFFFFFAQNTFYRKVFSLPKLEKDSLI